MNTIEKSSKLYFDNASETYTKNMHIQYEVFTKVLALIDGLPIQSITDIGCGTGIITRKLHEHFNSQLTTGIDTSTTMIAHARRHFESDILKFYQKSALDFTDQDNADLVFSNATFQWIPDLELLFKNFKSTCNPKTTIAFSMFLPQTYQELLSGLRSVIDNTITIPAERFKPENQIKEICQSFFPTATFYNHTITHHYANIIELLTIIKRTGSKDSNAPIHFTPQKLKALETWFQNTYGKIPATYDVLIGIITV